MESEYCSCGAPLAFSPDGVHCVGCYESLSGRVVGQYWHCENEACLKDISGDGERYQCVGCEGWFCVGCSSSFQGSAFRVCASCRAVWENLCRVQEAACCAVCGSARENSEVLLCTACQRLFDGR
jgi:hypothetical protein